MDKVMNVTFKWAFRVYALLVLVVICIIVFSSSWYWKGFAASLAIVLVLAITMEIYGSQRNAGYKAVIELLE